MKSFKDLHIGQEALGGLSAGIVGTVIGFPLDTIKTRMIFAGSSSSIIGVASSIVRNEGFLSLYKGIAPPLISLSILNTINFSQYCFFRELFGGSIGWDYRNGIAGLAGSPITASISTVENLVKTQLQMDNVSSKPRYTGSWNCVQSLVRSHGPLVLYTGHCINTLREGTFLGTYFFCYEGLREHIRMWIPTQVAIPVAGGFAGAISWFVSFPLDCVRARVQGQDLDAPGKPRALQVMRQLLEQQGIRGLYSGVTPSIVRAFLVSGSRFSAYEGALWLLRGGRDVHD